MERLTKKQLRTLLEFILECHPNCDHETLAQRIVSRLAKAAQLSVHRYNERGLSAIRQYRVNSAYRGCSGSAAEPLARNIHKNARSSHHANNSEVGHEYSCRPDEFHPRWSLHYRTVAQLLKNLTPTGPTKYFDHCNELLLEQLTPYLSQSRRKIRTEARMQQKSIVLEHALNIFNLGLVILTPHAKIRLATRFAIQQIENYFGQEDVDSDDLPQALRTWISQQQFALKRKDEASLRADPLVLKHWEKRLIIRVVFDLNQTILLFEEQPVITKSSSGSCGGLTSREDQVLHWVSQGKTNKEIGVILEVSPRTVQKHLEHVYQKLGVNCRTAAAGTAFEMASMATKQAGILLVVISYLCL